jgi:protein gp37
VSDKTKIEWTDATWNPLVGCSRVSAGCINCYAERHAYRFARQPGTVYEGTARLVNGRPTFTGRVNLNERVLDVPLRWKRPRRIFVNSMSDLFHESVANATIDRIFAVMALAPRHTFQVLTKRPERMLQYLSTEVSIRRIADRLFDMTGIYQCAEVDRMKRGWEHVRNIWLGVSVEDQAAADSRIPLLLRTPAAVRFLSCEPLLGPISFEGMFANQHDLRDQTNALEEIDWVIAGGESGPRARPMNPQWARDLRDQCSAVSVPFFFKQWGEWLHESQPESAQFVPDKERGGVHVWDDTFASLRVGKRAAGRMLDGRVHNAFPEAA